MSSAPAILLVVAFANIDALSALGLLLPAGGGLLLLALKPQVAGLAAAVWMAEGRWRAAVGVSTVILLSTLVWPEWIERVRLAPSGAVNVSFFPWSLLVGVPLLWHAIRRRDILLAAILSPLFSPYVAIYSLAPTIALMARKHLLLGLAGNLGGWLLLGRLVVLNSSS